MSSISPAIKNKDELETILCGGCDRPEENCYCRIVECICCGGTDHRYNMRSNMEINDDFYTLEPEEQDRNLMCETCIHNDGGDTDSEDEENWYDEEQSEDDYDEY